MKWTKESIIDLVHTNDRALGRALVVLKNRQTRDEVQAEHTKHLNGRGFRPAHAKMGTSMAQQFERTGSLSGNQQFYWRHLAQKTGKSRIQIYWRQLLEETEAKALLKSNQN